MIISRFPSGGSSSAGVPQFTYTGNYKIITDAEGWRVKFLSSGVLTMLNTAIIDVFLVGGGGNGSGYNVTTTETSQQGAVYRSTVYGSAGGGGYTVTSKGLTLSAGSSYNIVVGYSGEASSITPDNASEWEAITASGGKSGVSAGGNGGSGGAGSGIYQTYMNGSYYSGSKQIPGGVDGSNGTTRRTSGGSGQGTTTREFGEINGEAYASGGNAVYSSSYATIAPENSGNGGCGGVGYSGASGIVIIRNTRA